MAAGKPRDPNIGEFAQMAVFSLALAVTMFVFGFKEDGFSTRFLCFAVGGVFVLTTGFFAFVTLGLTRPPKTVDAATTPEPGGALRQPPPPRR